MKIVDKNIDFVVTHHDRTTRPLHIRIASAFPTCTGDSCTLARIAASSHERLVRGLTVRGTFFFAGRIVRMLALKPDLGERNLNWTRNDIIAVDTNTTSDIVVTRSKADQREGVGGACIAHPDNLDTGSFRA